MLPAYLTASSRPLSRNDASSFLQPAAGKVASRAQTRKFCLVMDKEREDLERERANRALACDDCSAIVEVSTLS